MIAALVALGLAAAAIGHGRLVLGVTGAARRLEAREEAAWSFVLGIGVLGWLVFFLALGHGLDRPWLMLTAAAGLPGLALLRRPAFGWSRPLILVAVAAAALALTDLAEALTPPSDADSLAYHFLVPRDMLRAGGLLFEARAVDGAVPMLVQMTYLPALALGGERAMTLWSMLTGWGLGWLVYAVARRWLGPGWAGTLALAVLTMPTLVLSAGTGQIEVRLALFVTVLAFAAAEARRGDAGFAAVAGLAAGFAMAAKYPGLLAAFAGGVVILSGHRRWRNALVFTAIAMIAGGQWYWWNWVNAGDPVFPMLHGLVPPRAAAPWSPEQQALFQQSFVAAENAVPKTPLWFLLYPVYALVAQHSALEAGRAGLGVLPLLLAPFAALGLWCRGRAVAASPLVAAVAVVILIYVLWFFLGPSQRVRHLVPLMPVLLLAMTVAARHAAAALPGVGRPLVVAFAAALSIHGAAVAVHGATFMRAVAAGESRVDFLERMVGGAAMAAAVDSRLAPGARLLINDRQLRYFFDTPTFLGHLVFQQVVTLGLPSTPERFLAELRANRITHVLAPPSSGGPDEIPLQRLTAALVGSGCARVLETYDYTIPLSRSLSQLGRHPLRRQLVEIAPPPACLPENPPS